VEIIKGISMTQKDINEIQLAKAAVSTGIRVLCNSINSGPEKIENIFLAGAFGTYVNLLNAQKIGLLEFDTEKVTKIGNSALIGAKMMLYFKPKEMSPILQKIRHISLETDPEFQEIFAMLMLL
jgi:uncharacterized 2Fe-2S/4Fe-4S cluster protein (DUF4445 family)